jgi:hypothetical protein
MELQSQAISCANCKADFSNPSGWKPLSKQTAFHKEAPRSTVQKVLRALLMFSGVIALLFWVLVYVIFSQGVAH